MTNLNEPQSLDFKEETFDLKMVDKMFRQRKISQKQMHKIDNLISKYLKS